MQREQVRIGLCIRIIPSPPSAEVLFASFFLECWRENWFGSLCSTFCLLLFLGTLKSILVWISIKPDQVWTCSIAESALQCLWLHTLKLIHLISLIHILKYWFKLCICIYVYAVANTWVGGGSMIYWPTEAPLSYNWFELLTVVPHAKMVNKGFPPTHLADILTNSPNWGASVSRPRSNCP